uniref:Spliceosome-associated protein CWC27 homolog n=1 Tax=Saccoglossus kowalevskii TaxID=10224 RepID=A0ABM0M0K6_SACKO|nr:PREDICTED: peptidyl-prolyl cis-trans isomerase CWC27 homolog [Saccoglossus kowalevskii]
MSTIYIHEPPTNGKVLMKTTVGDIDLELWSKEAPKACRNFIQLCMEGYYNGTLFHRVIKGYIVQGGDPTGTGEGGESIYGKPFKDEFHQRLKFNRRGLVAMANAGPHDNGSQFFFTLGRADNLQNKHTIFGKVTGTTLYNMLKLAEVETDKDDRPEEPHKIKSVQILSNPFDDIIPRNLPKKDDKKDAKKSAVSKSKATKNFSLLSFGEEAEEDEEETSEQLRKESRQLKKEMLESKKKKEQKEEKPEVEEEDQSIEDENKVLDDFHKERKKYVEMKKKQSKGSSREEATLALLSKFQSRLHTARISIDEENDEKPEKTENVKEVAEDEEEKDDENDIPVESWIKHRLKFENHAGKVKDANIQDEDTFAIHDPRNPINKRRREDSKKKRKEKSRR